MLTKHDITQGAGYLGQNAITWGQATALASHPAKYVNKAE
jgi:hypothetical protein